MYYEIEEEINKSDLTTKFNKIDKRKQYRRKHSKSEVNKKPNRLSDDFSAFKEKIWIRTN